MSLLGFRQTADVLIRLSDTEKRKSIFIDSEDGRSETLYIFYDGESIGGKVEIRPESGKKLSHLGIKLEFIGQIELFYDRGNHHIFTYADKTLAKPCQLAEPTTYNFNFPQVSKPYESYTGVNANLRYFLRVTIIRSLSGIVKTMDIVVHTLSFYPDVDRRVQLEIGLPDLLHLEVNYNRSRFHLEDVIVGEVYFTEVGIKIASMYLSITRKEMTGLAALNRYTDMQTVANYELMDGTPVKGSSVPIRIFLGAYKLGPTMRYICDKFDVRYLLSIQLFDEDGRKYFQEEEIILWRKADMRALRKENIALVIGSHRKECTSVQKGIIQQPSNNR